MKRFTINKYIVYMEPIGKGWDTIVYRGYDTIKKRSVAIKITTKLRSAYREVKVMKRYGKLKYFPVLYDFFIKKNKAYIVMEYIDGKILGGDFNSYGKIYEENYSVEIIIHTLKGLHRLHQIGYYHWDVKPENIIVANNNPIKIKIIDFNMARPIKEKESIQKDIRVVAKMYIFLTNGTIRKPIEKATFKNLKLKSVIFKAFNKKSEGRYNSAKEFYDALIPFI